MIYCLAVFRSRTHTVGFIEFMRSQGLDARAVNTPEKAKIGCGISARFPIEYTSFARHVISALSLTSFRGFYSVKKDGVRNIVTHL